MILLSGNTKGGNITVLLIYCLTGLDLSVLQIKTKIISSHTADSKPVKQEVNNTVILRPLVFPASIIEHKILKRLHLPSFFLWDPRVGLFIEELCFLIFIRRVNISPVDSLSLALTPYD